MERFKKSDVEALVGFLEGYNATRVEVSEDESLVSGTFGPEFSLRFEVANGRPWFEFAVESPKLNLVSSGVSIPLPKTILPASLSALASILDGYLVLHKSVRRIRRRGKK